MFSWAKRASKSVAFLLFWLKIARTKGARVPSEEAIFPSPKPVDLAMGEM